MGSKTIHIISHTHWDREWYLNSKFSNEWLVPFFDALFTIMEQQRGYRFILDGQTLIIEDLLDEVKARGLDLDSYRQKIRQYAGEKRLFIGPYYMQPDWQLAGEESLIRNLLVGHKISSQYGEAMKAGWLLDNFGQISQAPQIHRGFGIEGLFVWRGVWMDPHTLSSAFEWRSPDNSSVKAVYLLASYRNAMRLAESPEIFNGRVLYEAAKLEPFALADQILLMNGYDQEMVPDDILPHINALNHSGHAVTQSSPEDYLSSLEGASVPLNRLCGQLYNGRFISVFPGILSSRMYIKQRNDEAERLAYRYAEPVCTIASLLGKPYPADRIEAAWKLILKNLPHDSICGVSIDDVYTDMLERYAQSERILRDELESALRGLTAQVNTASLSAAALSVARAYVIFNTLPFERDGLIFIASGLSENLYFVDEKNNRLESAALRNGYRVQVKGIPSLGYKTIFAVHGKDAQVHESALSQNTREPVLENKFIRVKIHENGSISILDKGTGKTYSDLLIFEDGADCGDEYNYSPLPGETVFNTRGAKAKISALENNALRQSYKIELTMELPAGLAEGNNTGHKSRSSRTRELPIATWLSLDSDSPFIRFRTELRNTVKDHRLCVLFPTDIQTNESYSRTQFDVCAHPVNSQAYEGEIPAPVQKIMNGAYEPKPADTFPQLSFAGLEDGRQGAAVFNRGLPEYRVIPGRNTIALTLFRAVGSIARNDLVSRIGDAGPAIATPGAQCLRDMSFHYAFCPYSGSWESAGLNTLADSFNTGTLVWRTGLHNGALPLSKQFFRVKDEKNVVSLSCLKRSEDGAGIILRLYNNTRKPAAAEINAAPEIKAAELTTLDEKKSAVLDLVSGHSVRVEVGAKKIVTLKLILKKENILTYRESGEEIPVLEPEERQDFSACEAEPEISWAEVEREEGRVMKLEAAYREALEAQKTAEHEKPVKKSEAKLRTETVYRESLEAGISALLLRKNYFLLYGKDDAELRRELLEYEEKARAVGLCLNKARISKRAEEYILDYYRSRDAE